MAPHFTRRGRSRLEAAPQSGAFPQARHNSGYWGDDENGNLSSARTAGHGRRPADLAVCYIMLFGYAHNLFYVLRPLSYSGPRDYSGSRGRSSPTLGEVGFGIETRY